MAVERKANVKWTGDLLRGTGNIHFNSGAISDSPVTWASRTEAPGGKTSPEELLAAAHAACFSMALSAGLARARTPPKELDVSATCVLDKVGDAFRVTEMHLEVIGTVPGASEESFLEQAEAAEKGCPISNALKGNVKISLKATLSK
jgi:osmotically inducible protein OsmC